MIFWFDTVTSKEALLFDAIAKDLENEGHDVLFTCRDYDYVVSLFDLLQREVEVLGKHGGGTLFGKLMAGNERISLLANYVNDLEKKPDYHISFACPESTRVAFGLAIPVISVNDSPHAKAVAKLTVPYAKHLVYSSCIPKEKWLFQGVIEEQLQPYDGIDEVAWLKDYKPNEAVIEDLGLSKADRFIVARPEESSAAYMLDRGMAGQTKLDVIFDELFPIYNGLAIVFPRYRSQEEMMLKKYKDNIIIPPKAVDTLSLYFYSDLCLTGGATMAREAAAIGTPSISYYPHPLDVLEYISSIGIPLYNEYKLEDAIVKAIELIKSPRDKSAMQEKTNKIINGLESPVEKIKSLI